MIPTASWVLTRWMNRTYNHLSTYNDLNQVEANLTLSF